MINEFCDKCQLLRGGIDYNGIITLRFHIINNNELETKKYLHNITHYYKLRNDIPRFF